MVHKRGLMLYGQKRERENHRDKRNSVQPMTASQILWSMNLNISFKFHHCPVSETAVIPTIWLRKLRLKRLSGCPGVRTMEGFLSDSAPICVITMTLFWCTDWTPLLPPLLVMPDQPSLPLSPPLPPFLNGILGLHATWGARRKSVSDNGYV